MYKVNQIYMLKLEYLIFVDNSGIKCNNEKTFNHLLQSNPDIEIKNKKINYKDIIVNYDLSFGQIADTDSTYFHLVFNFDDIDKIDLFYKLNDECESVNSIRKSSNLILKRNKFIREIINFESYIYNHTDFTWKKRLNNFSGN